MLVNSRGIVLSTLRYSDSSIIARIYTEVAGLRPFMVRVEKAVGPLARSPRYNRSPLSPYLSTPNNGRVCVHLAHLNATERSCGYLSMRSGHPWPFSWLRS
jgi:recombinational DNA repair protein (RecF pathway)